MGRDNLSIVSLNSARRGFESLKETHRTPYLERILQSSTPDICFLPGDDKAIGPNAVVGYQQFPAPSGDGTVLLYNYKRMTLRQPEVDMYNVIQPLKGLDPLKLVCPIVEVYAPGENRVVREFSMISWKYTLFKNCREEPTSLAESIILFAQRLAQMTKRPLLIGGEMPFDHGTLQNIVKKISHDNQEQFIMDISPEMKEDGYLTSNIKSSQLSQRHLFIMKVYRCSTSFTKPQEIVQTWNAGPPNADCFIASKALELTEAQLLDVEPVIGRKVEMINIANTDCQSNTETEVKQPTHRTSCSTAQHVYRPTSTTMTVQARPPKHSNG
ncbi:uncharacterized protein LOC127850261 [Dreissena polymorpha]|uniref:Uncharacterized protein n=1 Tax=Dreissena polymorpha TaxID=45954 RepID=A0A9D4HZL0_DREPO|nr:uncharacterized protein LOC127850261 [Dreissena polymorpha]XP_052239112.1 uncharacterized protein LOC127850261 [Dreissena polymorpha]KAH3738729.1 hypothetical protein DPMN_045370 [Dreissena polymorpha]